MKKIDKLIAGLEPEQTFINELLANHTTLRIGGPADLFCRAQTLYQLVRAVREAKKLALPVTILGGGSNVLVSDKGVRGLVIKNEMDKMKIGKELSAQKRVATDRPRWQSDYERGTFKYEFADLDYDESDSSRVQVELESGVLLQKAVSELLGLGITGLQWFAKIPGTIGGAIHNNIHGGTHFISEVVKKVKVLDKDNKIRTLSGKALGLSYDKSRFHDFAEIILSVEFELFRGDAKRAKQVAFEWAKRKSLQPPRSAGCTFKNISNEDKERLDFPTTSAGYIIEHILKMSGYKIGGAKVSTSHHNFVVNDGDATAKDYTTLVKLIQKETKKKLDIDLVPEIIFLGEFWFGNVPGCQGGGVSSTPFEERVVWD